MFSLEAYCSVTCTPVPSPMLTRILLQRGSIVLKDVGNTFFFKSVWSALSYETISAELILWICFKTPEGGFGMVDTAQPCASESRQLSRSVTGVQSSLVLLSLQEIRGKPFIYTQGILAKME